MRADLPARLGQTVLVVFLSLTAVFFLMRLGGGLVLLFLPVDIQAKDLTEFRERLGFNDPVAIQYGRFILVLERLPAVAVVLFGMGEDAARRRARLDVRGEAGPLGAGR